MTKTKKEIAVLEERLRQAELGPDPETFEDLLADNVVLVDQSGTPALAKRKVVEAHRAGKGTKFTNVEIRDWRIVEHGTVVVVTCVGTFTGPQFSGALKFMRVWQRKNGRWR